MPELEDISTSGVDAVGDLVPTAGFRKTSEVKAFHALRRNLSLCYLEHRAEIRALTSCNAMYA